MAAALLIRGLARCVARFGHELALARQALQQPSRQAAPQLDHGDELEAADRIIAHAQLRRALRRYSPPEETPKA